jgi:hypothetical protein
MDAINESAKIRKLHREHGEVDTEIHREKAGTFLKLRAPHPNPLPREREPTPLSRDGRGAGSEGK